MSLSLTDEKTRMLFVDIFIELLTKRQDIFDEVIAKAQQQIDEKQHQQAQILIKKETARAYLQNVNLDFYGYKFNREEANER